MFVLILYYGLLVCPMTVKSILSLFKGRMICQVFSVCLFVYFVCLLDYGLDRGSDLRGRYRSRDGFVSCSCFSRIVFERRSFHNSNVQKTLPNKKKNKQTNSLRLFSILFAFNNVGHCLRNDGTYKEVMNFFLVLTYLFNVPYEITT